MLRRSLVMCLLAVGLAWSAALLPRTAFGMGTVADRQPVAGLATGDQTLAQPDGSNALALPVAGLPAVQVALLNRLQDSAAGQMRVAYHAATGKLRFVGTDLEHPVPRPEGVAPAATPEQAARAFLSEYGVLFGLEDQARDLRVLRLQDADRGRSFVRFQQLKSGIPVLGGELIVQVDAERNVVSVSGEVLPDAALDFEALVSRQTAQETAMALVAKVYGVSLEGLTVDEPVLWIYSPSLLGSPGLPINALVWRTEVRSDANLSLRELVLVDARLGGVTLHFNKVKTARNRRIYDNQNDPNAGLPGTGPVRTEGQGPSGNAEVDDAYEFTGDTYDFYVAYHGRDSLDGRGLTLISTVRWCAPAEYQWQCPLDNAFWNGEQMVFGQGYASADDVVGHELTHGVTDYESSLFYYMQSGAINESFSDIWGEFIDLTNGAGNDSPSVRWLMGEDLPGGAGRNMANPPALGHPDRMNSPYYYYSTVANEEDNGGVHENSGVGNKAAYLLTDGGTFNGRTVQGLGMQQVAAIYYEVNTHLLTSAGDYADLYDALVQACTDLIGTHGITAEDVEQVRNAAEATEMNQTPSKCPAVDAPICSGEDSPADLFYDDFENLQSGKWISRTVLGENAWYYPPPGLYTYATSGYYNLVGWDVPRRSESYIAMTSDVNLPADRPAYMHFSHAYQFEWYPAGGSYFDGGIVAYSTDGGSSWRDAGGLIVENGYNATLFAEGDNPLAGWRAFGGESCGYISSRLDLSSLSGQRVRFAFVVSTDKESVLEYYGWFIDDVRVYTCGPGPTREPTETRTPVVTRTLSPTATPTATSRPFTPTVRVRLPVILRDAWSPQGPTATEVAGPTFTPTRTLIATRTVTPTRTPVIGPTPTGFPESGGPDAFGYTWTRNAEYDWIDATSGGVPINWGNRGPFNIGFPFQFYGATYNQFYLNSGMLQFGRSDSWSQVNGCIPNPGPPNSFAAAFWDAVGSYQSAPGTFHKLVGQAPNRIAVVEVSGIQHVNDGAPMTFEVLLIEGSNDIVVQYQSMRANSRGDAREATIGLEDSTGRIGLQVSCNLAWLYDGAVIWFQYPQ